MSGCHYEHRSAFASTLYSDFMLQDEELHAKEHNDIMYRPTLRS